MVMMEKHPFFEQEERDDPGEQRREDLRSWKRLERFGEQQQERDCKQRADRVTYEPGHELCSNAIGEEQQGRGDEHAAHAAEKTQAQGGRQEWHGTS
jgi:hypothetical protein